jgi:hypothetical protein
VLAARYLMSSKSSQCWCSVRSRVMRNSHSSGRPGKGGYPHESAEYVPGREASGHGRTVGVGKPRGSPARISALAPRCATGDRRGPRRSVAKRRTSGRPRPRAIPPSLPASSHGDGDIVLVGDGWLLVGTGSQDSNSLRTRCARLQDELALRTVFRDSVSIEH